MKKKMMNSMQLMRDQDKSLNNTQSFPTYLKEKYPLLSLITFKLDHRRVLLKALITFFIRKLM